MVVLPLDFLALSLTVGFFVAALVVELGILSCLVVLPTIFVYLFLLLTQESGVFRQYFLPSMLVIFIFIPCNAFPPFRQVPPATFWQLVIIPLYLLIVFVAREVDLDKIFLCLSAPCLCLHNTSPSLVDQLLHIFLDSLVAHLEILITQDAIATLL